MAATPLTKARPSSVRTVKRDLRPLAASATAWKGALAAVLNGYFQPASGTPGEIVVGRFYDSVDNTGGTAGQRTCDVEFFRERELFLVDNDAGAPVVVANREGACSILDDHSATLYSSAIGGEAIVYDVTTEGVWIELLAAGAATGTGAGGPRVQAGTTTLVAGTKTISGVTLTANSRILLSMKDPGAGAITSFAALDAPAGSRNTGAGTFVINAIDASKAVIATAVSTVDYLVIG